MTLQQIIEYYVNLLIIQYNNKPNAQATIAALINQLLADNVFFDVVNGYDIDTAVGAQLDIIGKYVGVDRFYTGQDLSDYFAFIEYDTDPVYGIEGRIGFCDYSDIGLKPGKWLTYDGIISTTFSLPDEDFRTLIKLKILQDNTNSSNAEIDNGLFTLFGTRIIAQDNYDMTMTYYVDTSLKALIDVAYSKQVLPKPMGVEINDVISVNFLVTEDGELITTAAGDPIVVPA